MSSTARATAAAVADSAAGARGACHLGSIPAAALALAAAAEPLAAAAAAASEIPADAPTPPVSKAPPGLSTAGLRSRAPTEVPAQMRRP